MGRDAHVASVGDDEGLPGGLSEQERAALQAAEDDDEQTRKDLDEILNENDDSGDGKPAAGDGDGGGDGDGDGKSASGEGDGKDGDVAAAAGDGDGEGAGDEDEAPTSDRFVPLMEVKPVEDYEAKLADIDRRRAEIRQKREDGDIEFAEAEKQLDALSDERSDLKLAQQRAIDAAAYNEQTGDQEWKFEVRSFLRDHREYQDEVMWGALDSTVKALANQVQLDPESGEPVLRDGQPILVNEDKDAHWFLAEAHKRVSLRLKSAAAAPQQGADGAAGKKPAAGEEDPKAKAVGARRRQAADRPTTVAGLPEAEDSGETGAGRFAHLDNLKGMELENAVAALSPAEQQAYLRGE